MNTVKCNAKDPSSCRYHRPDAGAVAKAALDEAKSALVEAERLSEVDESNVTEELDARWKVDKAEEIYYATEEGIKEIKEKISNETNEGEKVSLEMKLTFAQYALADAERTNAINVRNGGALIPAGTHTYEVGSVTGGGNDLWPTATGSKYERGLRAQQVKTKLNADFKEAQKKGYLPKQIKFAATSHRDRLEVKIIGAANEQIYNDPDTMRRSDLTPQGRELLERVNGMVSSYQDTQYDVIEGRTNHANFWESVGYETDWDKSRREEKEGAAALRRLAKKDPTNN
jgi:hypothetical protein